MRHYEVNAKAGSKISEARIFAEEIGRSAARRLPERLHFQQFPNSAAQARLVVLKPFLVPRDEALANAPHRDERGYLVPAVLGE